METIKNKYEFTKLFDINIPLFQHFDYYIDILKRVPENSSIQEQIDMFITYEKHINNSDYDFKKYIFDIAFKSVKCSIESSERFKKLIEFGSNLQNLKIPSFQGHDSKMDQFLISIDLNAANYQTLIFMQNDSMENKLNPNWESLLKELNIDICVAKSKSFRQYAMGNINPKLFARVQHYIMYNISELLVAHSLFFNNILSLMSDEIIIGNINPDEINEYINTIDIAFQIFNPNIKYKVKIYKNRIVDEKVKIKDYYKIENNTLIFDYSKLYGTPGTRYYHWLKKYILNEEIDERDLLFKVDGDIVKWVI